MSSARTGRPGRWASDGLVYRVKDVFPVWHQYGGWDVNPNQIWTIPQWARDSYLKPVNDPHFCDPGGGDHNIICAVLDEAGNFISGAGILQWWYDALTGPVANTSTDKYAKVNTSAKGWCDFLLAGSGGSNYKPQTGAHGPYKIAKLGAWDVI